MKLSEEKKELLLKDLSARIPYKVKVNCTYDGEIDGFPEDSFNTDFVLNEVDLKYPDHRYWIGGPQLQEKGIKQGTTDFATDSDDDEEVVKPYLRPMSDMTEEEQKQFDDFCVIDEEAWKGSGIVGYINQAQIMADAVDFLNSHHFDFRGLIEKGLAIEAPKDMYK